MDINHQGTTKSVCLWQFMYNRIQQDAQQQIYILSYFNVIT